MISTPFIVFYIVGLVLQLDMLYLLKMALFTAVYVVVYGISRILFDERLMTVMPMAVYLATKASLNFLEQISENDSSLS